MSKDTKHLPWLWPDHEIGKRESRRLRDEHNAAINALSDALSSARGSDAAQVSATVKMQAERDDLLNLVRRLVDWARIMGGWDAACWERAHAWVEQAGPEDSSTRGPSAPLDKFAEYVAEGGTYCPHCGDHDISADAITLNGVSFGPVESEGREAWQVVTCRKCGKQWRDVFTLTRAEAV